MAAEFKPGYLQDVLPTSFEADELGMGVESGLDLLTSEACISLDVCVIRREELMFAMQQGSVLSCLVVVVRRGLVTQIDDHGLGEARVRIRIELRVCQEADRWTVVGELDERRRVRATGNELGARCVDTQWRA